MLRLIKIIILVVLVLFVSLSGCMDSSMSVPKDSDGDGLSDDYEAQIGSDPNDPDSDADGMNDGDEVDAGRDPMGSDVNESITDLINPPGTIIYHVGATMGALSEDGNATFMWTFKDENGWKPSTMKFACVTPIELPSAFWSKYDNREALMGQSDIDKKADNLYIRFDEEGMITFSLNTYKIPGTYRFKICGILDENYTDESSYAGDGDEISVEVTEPVEVESISRECEPSGYVQKPAWNAECFVCKWHLFENESDIVNTSDIGFIYTPLLAPDGNNHSGLFLLKEEKRRIDGQPSSSDYTIYRWPGVLQGCGQFGNCGKCGYGDDGILYYTICLTPGDTVTISIVKADEKWFTYSGTGDPIVISLPEEGEVSFSYPD